MREGKSDTLCQDCDATFAAFLEQMAEHNAEQMAELNRQVVCPTCGKIHQYTPPGDSSAARRPAN